MKEYDVFIAGGAVAGPVAAKFCAKQGLKTLLRHSVSIFRKDNRGSHSARSTLQSCAV